jgi:tetratricopeptide (TPR) repeat protein
VEAAVRELRAASGLKRDSEQIDLALGIALNQSNHPEQADDIFKAVLKSDPNSIPALDGLTEALMAEKRYSAVIDYLKNAPPDEVLQLNLAIAYSNNGNLDEALQTLSTIVKEHPDYCPGPHQPGNSLHAAEPLPRSRRRVSAGSQTGP